MDGGRLLCSRKRASMKIGVMEKLRYICDVKE
jgi:hypothetical protein